jgi:hypothetical protein
LYALGIISALVVSIILKWTIKSKEKRDTNKTLKGIMDCPYEISPEQYKAIRKKIDSPDT